MPAGRPGAAEFAISRRPGLAAETAALESASRGVQDFAYAVKHGAAGRVNMLVSVERRCLVCDYTEQVREPETTDAIGPPCSRCRAPSERIRVLPRHSAEPNPHAAALGRLGGLKGGPARAAALSPRRRRDIARAAARARWKLRTPNS